MNKEKPLGRKSYGSIPHLKGSRLGVAEKTISDGQCRILTDCKRDKHDTIIVQEKLDGGNVGIAKLDGEIIALTRSGYTAKSSPYRHHHIFNEWVEEQKERFSNILREGERVCGEWLYQACGTIYDLPHEPFVMFDIYNAYNERYTYDYVKMMAGLGFFVTPNTISIGEPVSIYNALLMLGDGDHGALEECEGLIYRVERKGRVDFLAKYVRPSKVDGKYMIDKREDELINNTFKSNSYVLNNYKNE